jgi:quinol monooxygenase YgiN
MSTPPPGRVVVSRFRAKPGKAEELIEVFRWHSAATHEEPAVRVFALHREPDDPDSFVVVESYDTDADLWRHKETPHYERSMALLPDLIDGKPESILYDPVALGDPVKGVVG